MIASEPARQRKWPQPDAKALYGVAGDFVRLVEPHSEADPVAILIQTLITFGNVIGRNAYAMVEETRHCMNLFAVLVGSTSSGRKGTSWAHVRRRFEAINELWGQACITSGLSSAEGLIFAVRDEVIEKRALIVEGEFASVLRVQGREGNTLSTLLRQAWDTGDLRTMTKVSPLRATGAHISIIGHITHEELLRCLDATDTANGYANRFLWLCVQRSKLLPEGGNLQESDLASINERFTKAVDFAVQRGEMRRDEEARALWYQVYGELTRDRLGLFGKITARAAAQVLRLSAIYALLDCSETIRRVHLEAALALWRYCEDSARYIFGDRIGDPVADRLLDGLRAAGERGLALTDISDVLMRNVNAQKTQGALKILQDAGLAYFIQERTEGKGRPAVRWFATVEAIGRNDERNERNE
jgi:hypothetical protein